MIAENQVKIEESKQEEDEEQKDEQAKSLIEFKNVSEVLIDLIENPPSIQYMQDEVDIEDNEKT